MTRPMFRAALLLAAFAVAGPAMAQTKAAPPEWTVTQPQSKLGFSAAMNGQGFSGTFARWTARIRFDPKNLAASRVVVVVDMRSARTGDATRDESLPTDDWFAAKTFPTAVFIANQFRDLGGGRYAAAGTLKMRDVTAKVTLPFTLAITGADARMQGSVTIDRRSFGVGQGQFATADPVATAVRIDVTVVARRVP